MAPSPITAPASATLRPTLPRPQPLAHALEQQLAARQRVRRGLADPRLPEDLLRAELVEREVDLLAGGQAVPAVVLVDRGRDARDEDLAAEVLTDDVRAHGALAARDPLR